MPTDAADDGAVSSGPVDSARAADTEPPAAATASTSADATSTPFDLVSAVSILSILSSLSRRRCAHGMTIELGIIDGAVGAVTAPPGSRWQAVSQPAATGAHSAPPARPLSLRKSVTQAKDSASTRAAAAAVAPRALAQPAHGATPNAAACSSGRARSRAWRTTLSTATITAASIRKIGSVVYREPGSTWKWMDSTVTQRDSVAAAAASRNPHPRATAATSRTRAGWVTAIAPNTAASAHPTSRVAPFLPAAACSHQSRCQPRAGSTTSWATKPSTPPGLDVWSTRELCAARMTGTCSSRPAARPAVTACSRTRRSAAIRRISSGASASASGVDAPARNPISAGQGHPAAAARPPQAGPEEREQQVPRGVDAAVGDFKRRDRKQQHRRRQQPAQPDRVNVARARVEDE